MSLCLCIIEKGGKELHIAADSRASTKIENESYMVHDDGKKIHQIGDMIVFFSGALMISDEIVERIMESNTFTVEYLHTTSKEVWAKHKQPLQVLVARIENGKAVVYVFEDEDDFSIKRIINNYNSELKIVIGSGSHMARKIANNLFGKMDIWKLYKHIFDTCSNEQIGGTLTYYHVNPKRILKKTHLIKSKPNLKQLPQEYYDRLHLANGQILIDANQRILNLDNFDMIIGNLTAENIDAEKIFADMGVINDLTVNKLRTVTPSQLGQIDFIDIQGKSAKWSTAYAVETDQQAIDSKGRPLYWTDSTKSMVTIEDTGLPVNVIEYQDRYDKAEFTFASTGAESFPIIRLGVGDGKQVNSGKGFISKPVDGMYLDYYAQTTADQRQIAFTDAGITMRTVNGNLRLEHSNGSYIEIGANGINIHSTGSVRINGQEIHLN